MPDYANWQFDVDDHVCTLTLNRPDTMNILTPDTLHELRDITTQLEADSAIWAVILKGAGEHFSAGMDVKTIEEMVEQDPEAFSDYTADLQRCLDAFEALSKPTIASITGYCIGGGLILALCCDFRLAATDALFHLPEVKLGIAVLMGTQRISRIAGIAHTKEMILLAERFTAEKARSYGLVNDVVAAVDLDEAVIEIAAQFRHRPPRTVGIAKQIIDQGYAMSRRESQDLEIELQSRLLNSPDFAEGVRAFFEKRKPQFKGE